MAPLILPYKCCKTTRTKCRQTMVDCGHHDFWWSTMFYHGQPSKTMVNHGQNGMTIYKHGRPRSTCYVPLIIQYITYYVPLFFKLIYYRTENNSFKHLSTKTSSVYQLWTNYVLFCVYEGFIYIYCINKT